MGVLGLVRMNGKARAAMEAIAAQGMSEWQAMTIAPNGVNGGLLKDLVRAGAIRKIGHTLRESTGIRGGKAFGGYVYVTDPKILAMSDPSAALHEAALRVRRQGYERQQKLKERRQNRRAAVVPLKERPETVRFTMLEGRLSRIEQLVADLNEQIRGLWAQRANVTSAPPRPRKCARTVQAGEQTYQCVKDLAHVGACKIEPQAQALDDLDRLLHRRL